MTFHQLEYIVAVARCGSINKAAQELFVSQSGISTAIRSLEKELNVCLLSRGSHGTALTEEGKEFVSYAISLLEQRSWLEGLYTAQKRASTTRFIVASQHYPFAEDAFLRILRHRTEQNYLFGFREADMEQVIADVAEQTADIGIIFLSEQTAPMIRRILKDRGLKFHSLLSSEPCVFVRNGHPLANYQVVEVAWLQKYPYAAFFSRPGMAADMIEEYSIPYFPRHAQVIQSSDRQTIMDIIKNTDAYTIGTGLLSPKISPEEVITRPIHGQGMLEVGWIELEDFPTPQKTLDYIEELEEAIERSIEYTEKLRRYGIRGVRG